MPDIYTILQKQDIPYTKFDHPAVFTVAESEKLDDAIPGGKSKNLFLRNKKGDAFFLVVMAAQKRADLKKLAEQLHEPKLSFGSPEKLMELLGVTPGSVTALALINDADKKVTVVMDTDLWKCDTLQCHPLVNTATLVIPRSGMQKFFDWRGNEVKFLTI